MEVIIASGVASVASALIVGIFKEHQLEELRHQRRIAEKALEEEKHTTSVYRERSTEWHDEALKGWKENQELLHQLEEMRQEQELKEKQQQELKEETLEELEQIESKVYFLEDLLKTMAAASAIQRTREENEPCSNIQ